MILVVDIGNTRAKWSVAGAGGLPPARAVEHSGRPEEWIAQADFPPFRQAWIAHVLGADHDAALARALEARSGVTPHFARARAEHHGLRSAYPDPARLGVDRWLAMLAVWTRERGAFCVVNAGTALTFDAVDAQGQHLGGLIAPGLVAAQQAVRNSTRFPLRQEPAAFTDVLGRDTESCVRQGALHACAGLAERAARSVAGARYLTGGDAEVLHAHLGREWHWRRDLVLEGLLALAQSS